MATFNGTEEECEELARILDKADGGPKRGVHVGGGIHVPMPAQWDGEGEVPIGWTSHKAAVKAEATDFVISIDDVAKVDDSKLDESEKTWLEVAFSPTEADAPIQGELWDQPAKTR